MSALTASSSVVALMVGPIDAASSFIEAGSFPGSTLGNLTTAEAVAFLRRMRRQLGSGSKAIVGIDLLKGLDVLLPAYDDREGVTAAFDLNILERANRELGADFSLSNFRHEARWNPVERAVEMHLVSDRTQTVTIAGQRFEFAVGDTIHTESSRKYDAATFYGLAQAAGWRVVEFWRDPKRLFGVVGMIAADPATAGDPQTSDAPWFNRQVGSWPHE